MGLLQVASLLRENGFRVTLIDCLDFSIKTNRYGDGKFFKTKIEKPHPLNLSHEIIASMEFLKKSC